MREIYHELFKNPAIGGTTMVRLPTLGVGNDIWAKCEYQNPSGSLYDRIYPKLFAELEEAGNIQPGVTTVVETTTGCAGISLAYFAQLLGYAATIFVPYHVPRHHISLMRGFGATVIKSGHQDRGDYMAPPIAAMRGFLRQRRQRIDRVPLFWSTNLVRTDLAWQALEPIASEMLAIIPRFHRFFDIAGNGCSLRGVGEAFKKKLPNIRVVAFEPFEAPHTYNQKYPAKAIAKTMELHPLFGTGIWGVPFPHLDHALLSVIDDVFLVTEDEWVPEQEKLDNLGFRVGPSSAAAYFLANRYCRMVSNQTVGLIFHDESYRY